MKSFADKGLIDLGVQIVQEVQTVYESNGFQSFQTVKTFQSFKESDAMLAINLMSADIIIENFAWSEKSK
jgi:hypothetical protein